MIYTSFPDTAVFNINGRTVASAIDWDHSREGFLSLTGEKLLDVVRRVDSVCFFKNGEEIKETDCSFEATL